ncbi:MAG: hypothetical protein NWE91_00540 [Candidatus Bathyarchaeota archaeon]|nr:hypothetical protein [Candidatus Bathyarchaeota archaeon]
MTRKCRVVRETKCVKVLTTRHIKETVSKYCYPFYPNSYEIIIPGRRYTKVPTKTRECAKKKKVKIRRFWGFK